MSTLLRIVGLSCSYGKHRVLEDLSMSMERGEVVGLLGANGCGKTTLFKCIGSMLPYEGEILLKEENTEKEISVRRLTVREAAKRISYIPQSSGISIDLSCEDVVLMGVNPSLKLLQNPTAAMKEEAAGLLAKAGLPGKEKENYQELSQGQKQLVLLARALISKAPLLLMDEPESALDLWHRYELMRQVKKYAETGRTALITLHDPQLALNLCDTVKVIHEGKVMTSFRPEETETAFMEEVLSKIYGPVMVTSCSASGNRAQYAVLPAEGTERERKWM